MSRTGGIEVVFHQRRPRAHGNYSLETLFAAVRANLPRDIHSRVVESPFPSSGLVPRIRNLRASAQNAGPLNHITGDSLYLALGLPGSRTILTVPDCAFLMNPSAVRRAIIKLFWYRLPTRRVAAITVISRFTRDQLCSVIPGIGHKVRVIYACTGFPMNWSPPARNARPVILQVGTTANKNIERLAAALGGLDCELHVVGALSRSQSEAIDGARVRLRNSVNLDAAGLAEAYRNADVVTFCSIYEGFGLPIVEAQMVGRPVVTSAVASMPEVAGDGACIVDPFDVAAIRKGVERVLFDREYCEKLVQRGRVNADRFRPALIASQYANLYRELAATASRS